MCSSQTFTVTRTADKWFVSFALDAEKVPTIVHPIETAGIDLGVKCLATVSDGTIYTMPNSTKIAKTKLGRMQWRNRHQVKGNRKAGIRQSNNAKKALLKISRLHARIANIRSDVIHKMTTDISKRVYRIRIEDLHVKGMVANHKLAFAVSNSCFYEIRRQFTYKQSMYGTKLEIVNRWYPSSKTCSHCGHVQPMPLSERVFDCDGCGQIIDRDLNASINLERAPDSLVRSA